MKLWRAIDCNDVLEGGKDVLTRHGWDADGGGTKGGVTQRSFTAYLQSYGLPVRDVETMTPEERTGVIFHRYWQPTGMMMPRGIDFMAFQFGYNAGTVTAIRKLQPLLPNYTGAPDGIVGPLMLKALHETGKNKNLLRCIISEYAAAQVAYYEALHAADPSRPLKGWKRRVRIATEMALDDLEGNTDVDYSRYL